MIRNAADVLKLEIETDASGMPNLVVNPTGANSIAEGGAWGWITPLVSTSISGFIDTLQFIVQPAFSTGPAYFQTDYMPLAAGRYVGARFDSTGIGTTTGTVKGRFQFFDSDKSLISQGSQSSAFGPTAGTHYVSAVQAPAGTAYVKLRFDFYDSGGDPGPFDFYEFTNVMVTHAASTFANSYAFAEPVEYDLDILGPTTTISITRKPLDPGMITVTVIDANLDPADADALRTGRRFRIRALNDDTADWENLAAGFTIRDPKVEYDLSKPADRQAQITLTVTDDLQLLANTARPNSVGTRVELPYVLETVGIPYSVNGSGSQVGWPVEVTVHQDGASALDQVVLLRDTLLGNSWINKDGVLNFWDLRDVDYYAGTAPADESIYSKIKVAWDTDQLINEVLVVLVHENTAGDMVETTYGPFRDAASVGTWKTVRQATFRVTGLDAAGITALAADILAANSTPVRRVDEITIPITSPADITPAKALIDLYALVNVTNTSKGIDVTQRVTSITHTIYANPDFGVRWLMTLGFGNEEAVSSPAPTGSGSAGTGAQGAAGPPGLPGDPGVADTVDPLVLTGDTLSISGTGAAHGDALVWDTNIDEWVPESLLSSPSFATVMAGLAPDGWWRHGESSGTTMVDSSGNSRNGTYSANVVLGATGLITGDSDTAMDLESTNSAFAGVTGADWMDTLTAVSFMAWFKPESVAGSSYNFIACRDDGNGTGNQWWLTLKNTKLNALCRGTELNGGTTVVAGTRYCGIFTYDGVNAKLYLNGSQEVSSARTGNMDLGNNDLKIGRWANVGSPLYFDGIIDETAYWKRALSAAEVAAIWDAGT